MPGQLNQKAKAWRLIFWQFAWVVLCVWIAGAFYGKSAIKACFMAGLVVMLPQIVFVILFFKHSGARLARQVLSFFYLGELLKLLLTGLLFAVILAKVSLDFSWFFITVLGSYTAYIWVPLFLERDI